MKKIKCNTCHQEFDSIHDFPTQASGCASEVIADDTGTMTVFSHYGSSFDTGKFGLTSESILQVGIVCDECLESEIASQNAIEDESYNYFDTY